MTTVAIVDDHSVVRIGMKYVIMTDREFKFVGEADDGAEAVSKSYPRFFDDLRSLGTEVNIIDA